MSTVVTSRLSTPAACARSTRASTIRSERAFFSAISSVTSMVPAMGASAPAPEAMAPVM